jgi:hypothetical protein
MTLGWVSWKTHQLLVVIKHATASLMAIVIYRTKKKEEGDHDQDS